VFRARRDLSSVCPPVRVDGRDREGWPLVRSCKCAPPIRVIPLEQVPSTESLRDRLRAWRRGLPEYLIDLCHDTVFAGENDCPSVSIVL